MVIYEFALKYIFSVRMDEEGQEWLYELLTEVQLEQFFTKLRDDLQVFRYVKRILSLY